MQFLESAPHDVYHLPAYARVAARSLSGRPTAFLAEVDGARCLIPLVRTELPAGLAAAGWSDAASPYGYASPLFEGDAARVSDLLAAFVGACRANRIVSVFLRGHPLLPPAWDDVDEIPGRIAFHGETVYLDLQLPDQELWHQTRQDRRRGIRSLERTGYRAVLDDWSHYPGFVRLYGETMSRLHASDFYRFSRAYFDELPRALPGRVHLCTVVDEGGSLACGGLFFDAGDIVQYHLSGTAQDHLRRGPSQLMLHYVARWAKERGARFFHLGGGFGAGGGSLLHFKAGFSKLRCRYHTIRLVADTARYTALAARAGCAGVPKDGTGFFPAYRKHT